MNIFCPLYRMPISEVVNLILHYSDHVSSMIANMDSGHKVELC